MKLHFIYVFIALTLEIISNIGSLERCIFPIRRETGTQNNTVVHHIGQNTEQSLHDNSRCYTYRIAEIAIALSASGIISTYLPEVSGASAQIHSIENRALEKFISLIATTALPVSQCRMHYLGKSDVIDRPCIRQPRRCSDCCIIVSIETIGLDRNMGNLGIDITGRLP